MYKYFFLLIFLFVVISSLNAHQQEMHQYITREAFYLLKKSFPNKLGEMESFLGNDETSGNGSLYTFGAFKIVSGAWIEDEYDIVYHYGIGNSPNYNQTLPINFIIDIFGSEREAHTSITHFWDADGGPDKKSFLHDEADGIYWSYSVENSYQKISLYLNGGYNTRYLFSKLTLLPGTYTYCMGYDWKYNSLSDLYLNGAYTITKYYIGPQKLDQRIRWII